MQLNYENEFLHIESECKHFWFFVKEKYTSFLTYSLNLEIAKLRVDMASCQEALDCAINEQDFVKAQEVKMKMQEFDAKRTEFEMAIQAEKNKTNKEKCLLLKIL